MGQISGSGSKYDVWYGNIGTTVYESTTSLPKTFNLQGLTWNLFPLLEPLDLVPEVVGNLLGCEGGLPEHGAVAAAVGPLVLQAAATAGVQRRR